MVNNIPKELAIYQASNGEIKLQEDIAQTPKSGGHKDRMVGLVLLMLREV